MFGSRQGKYANMKKDNGVMARNDIVKRLHLWTIEDNNGARKKLMEDAAEHILSLESELELRYSLHDSEAGKYDSEAGKYDSRYGKCSNCGQNWYTCLCSHD
jgi:RNA polymerase-binding transcription factor DksA